MSGPAIAARKASSATSVRRSAKVISGCLRTHIELETALASGRWDFRFNLQLHTPSDQRDGNRRNHRHRDAEPATVFHQSIQIHQVTIAARLDTAGHGNSFGKSIR